MSALFPVAFFFLTFLVFLKPNVVSGWREAFLLAAICWGVLTTASVDILSVFHLLRFEWVVSIWVFFTILAALLLVVQHKAAGLRALTRMHILNWFAGLSLVEQLMIGQIGFILGVVGLTAFIAPPNTWDSLTYHMPRVMHWIQNQSVNNYPTSIIRQIVYTPWAEYAILQFQILLGGDRLANAIQFFGMAGSVIGVSLIAKELGGDRRAQILSALIAATVPMGILQGSSTQNDLVVAFWLVVFIYFSLRLSAQPQWIYCCAAAAGLGLALLTKGIGYLAALPFFLGILAFGCKRQGVRFTKYVFVIVVITAALNSGYYGRNWQLYKNVFGPVSETVVFKSGAAPVKAVMSNLICNVGLQFGTASRAWNDKVERTVIGIHRQLGIDTTGPQSALAGGEFHIPGHPFHEDHAGNLLHSLFFTLIALIFIFSPRQWKILPVGYLLLLVTAFLIFNFMVEWRMFNNRFLLPGLILFSPWAAVTATAGRGQRLVWTLSLIFFISALPWVFLNQSRPILANKNIFNQSRQAQYFANNPGFLYSYLGATKHMADQSCQDVGLVMGVDSWEYPLWPLLKSQIHSGMRIEQVMVNNISAKTASGSFAPCVLIADEEETRKLIKTDTGIYVLTRNFAFLKVFDRIKPGFRF